MSIKGCILDSFVWVIFQIFDFCTLCKSFLRSKPVTYQMSHWAYGRFLGLVTLIAFLSYWSQANALIGQNGLSPWTEDLIKIENIVDQNPELNKWTIRPTLLWVQLFANHNLLFSIGSLSALFLTIGIFPTLCASISYACYLSLMVVGEPFLSFQWDALLCETLLLSLPFLPLTKFHKLGDSFRVNLFARYLIVALLAKLMLESGIVKFTSFGTNDENAWRDFTALDYHYWTQPLPHGLSPWIDSLPPWVDQLSLVSTYGVELFLPFLLFFPGNLRRIAVFGQIILQIAILLSGNYGFFNFLSLCLCIPLIDDQILLKCLSKDYKQSVKENKDQGAGKNMSQQLPAISLIQPSFLSLTWFLFAVTTYGHLASDIRGNQTDPILEIDSKWTDDYINMVRPTRAFNSYGLFRVMTTTRPEIIIEGSLDGKTWHPYAFKYKPTNPKQSPQFAGPHMPRIDWQMWFEGLNYERFAAHPFSRLLYHKFITMIALGKSIEDFKDLRKVLGPQEYQNLVQSPPEIQQRVLQNYNSLFNAFASRSLWFGKLLASIFEHRTEIMKQLGQKFEDLPQKPNYLRISLAHYSFADHEINADQKDIWQITPIKEAAFVISNQ